MIEFSPVQSHAAFHALSPVISFSPRDVPFYLLLGLAVGIFLFLFSRHKFKWSAVIYGDKLKGIILKTDVLKALFATDAPPVGTHDTRAQAGDKTGDKTET